MNGNFLYYVTFAHLKWNLLQAITNDVTSYMEKTEQKFQEFNLEDKVNNIFNNNFYKNTLSDLFG